MAIREITDDDLEAVRELLVEGFPVRSDGYWTKGLANLRSLPRVEGFPRYGYVVDADGAPQGLLLTITSDPGGRGARTHFSSWYVREGYRQFALLLFRHALELENTTFVNPSPAEHILPILETFGFEPYTRGIVMLDPEQRCEAGPHEERCGASAAVTSPTSPSLSVRLPRTICEWDATSSVSRPTGGLVSSFIDGSGSDVCSRARK
jgi:hypothetical protein